MAKWSLDDIAWEAFDASKVTPELTAVVKAAALVEHNGYDYARYLCDVFHDDEPFKPVIQQWAEEEVQHGRALAKWAKLADPEFDFAACFKRFTDGYRLPLDVNESVRGSRMGELLARCVVETGTSMYYTAIRERAAEPVLQAICAKIAADEFRHYKLFYDHMHRYLEKEHIGRVQRLRIAAGRVAESEDDELAYAFYAANTPPDALYERVRYSNAYMRSVLGFYRPQHIERMTGMVLKAVGLAPHGWLGRMASAIGWRLLQWRAGRVAVG